MKIVQVKIYTTNAFVLYAQLCDGEPPVWSVPKGSHQHHHFKKSVCQNIFIASIQFNLYHFSSNLTYSILQEYRRELVYRKHSTRY